ncbi:polycomb protein Asx isoform X2 [Lingula anatina]|uniref:Polycomb protein Asx isoform X2 n=1 Tax=Lingula anatina TaxID=7574 RepID=A0A1S3KEE2_LINAN|nr:polycomb protein Asx isoform X2 [Lingula anatina]|eukprot:XP_013420611.1 polycomb protein Asx isoform X2 [Lingula anatina]
MQAESLRERSMRKKKGRTWAEAAKIVLEKHPQTPMSHKEILEVIQDEGLKDISGTTPLACLNASLHANSRGSDSTFYKVAGRMGVYGLKCDLPSGAYLEELEEDEININEEGEVVEPPSQKTTRERKKEKVNYVTLPDAGKMVPPAGEDSLDEISVDAVESKVTVPQNGDLMQSEQTLSGGETYSALNSDVTNNVQPLTLKLRTRHKRRKNIKSDSAVYPRIKIKPIDGASVAPPAIDEGDSAQSASSSASSLANMVNSTGNADTPHSVTRSAAAAAAAASSTSAASLLGIPSSAAKTQSLRELLSTIPGFSMKPRKRTGKKLSPAAQLEQTKEGCIDLETPDSILTNVNLRALINKHTFTMLPPAYQYKLLQLLPECDKTVMADGSLRLSSTALNNEFFNKGCHEWRERLSEGEFTPENQQRIKVEEEKEQAKLDPWKVKHFEPIWGQKLIREPQSTLAVSSPILAAQLKASDAVQNPFIPTAVKIGSPVKKAKLVSTMLKQRAISQTVAASTGRVTQRLSSGTGVSARKTATATMGGQGHDVTIIHHLKRPPLSSSGSVAGSPPKKAKVGPSQAKTLAQIKAQTQAAKLQRAQNHQQQHHNYAVVQPSHAPHVPRILARSQGQTRTLAQIKAQTAEKKQLQLQLQQQQTVQIQQPETSQVQQPATANSQVIASSLSSLVSQPVTTVVVTTSPPSNPQGHTRTLAQIKAQNRAKMQARTTHIVHPPATPVSATIQQPQQQQAATQPVQKVVTVSTQPTFIVTTTQSKSPNRPADRARVVTISNKLMKPDEIASGPGVNLERSYAICQAVLQKSMVSILSKPGDDTQQQQQQHPEDDMAGEQSRPETPRSVVVVTQSGKMVMSSSSTADIQGANHNKAASLSSLSSSSLSTLASSLSASAQVGGSLSQSTTTHAGGTITLVQNSKAQQLKATAVQKTTPLMQATKPQPMTVAKMLEQQQQQGGQLQHKTTVSGNSNNGVILKQLKGIPSGAVITSGNGNIDTKGNIIVTSVGGTKILSLGSKQNTLSALLADSKNPQMLIKPGGSNGSKVATTPTSSATTTSALSALLKSQPANLTFVASKNGGQLRGPSGSQITVTGKSPTGAASQLQNLAASSNLANAQALSNITGFQVAGGGNGSNLPHSLFIGGNNVQRTNTTLAAIPGTNNVALITSSSNGTVTFIPSSTPVQMLLQQGGTVSSSVHLAVESPTVSTVASTNGTTTTSNSSQPSKCACNLKAMVMCQKCGAFCHDDCIGPSKLCVTCLITT